jgi:hypothetical protein
MHRAALVDERPIGWRTTVMTTSRHRPVACTHRPSATPTATLTPR